MAGVVFLWPVHPAASTAAAVRLVAFERAASSLGIPTTVIVPYHPGESPEFEGQRVMRPWLYDSFVGDRGFLGALLLLPSSTARLLHAIRESHGTAIMSSTPGVFVALQALVVSKLLGLPFVLDIRDSWELEMSTHPGRLRNRIKERIERLCARSAEHVFTVTPMLRERICAGYSLPPEVVAVVSNGADLSRFHPGSVQRTIDLVFSGSPARYRNVEGVLRSLAKLRHIQPNSRTLFLGWDRTPQTPEIRSLVEKLGIGSSVEIAPTIPHDGVPSVLSRARLGIVSLSGADGLRTAVGAKTYEYLACGVPLACLVEPGDSELRRLVEAYEVGFCASNPDEFAMRAGEILADDDRWTRLSANCVAAAAAYDRRSISERAIREFILPLLSLHISTQRPIRP